MDGKPINPIRRGVLYRLKGQMADLKNMNAKWYVNELLAEQKAKADALRPRKFLPG